MKALIEYTDTFGGEANYSWVKFRAIDVDTNITGKQIKRLAKEAMGLVGVRGVWNTLGEQFEFRPYNSCTVLFVSFV